MLSKRERKRGHFLVRPTSGCFGLSLAKFKLYFAVETAAKKVDHPRERQRASASAVSGGPAQQQQQQQVSWSGQQQGEGRTEWIFCVVVGCGWRRRRRRRRRPTSSGRPKRWIVNKAKLTRHERVCCCCCCRCWCRCFHWWWLNFHSGSVWPIENWTESNGTCWSFARWTAATTMTALVWLQKWLLRICTQRHSPRPTKALWLT